MFKQFSKHRVEWKHTTREVNFFSRPKIKSKEKEENKSRNYKLLSCDFRVSFLTDAKSPDLQFIKKKSNVKNAFPTKI